MGEEEEEEIMLLRDLLQRRVEERPVPFSASLAGFKEDPLTFYTSAVNI